MQKQQIEAEKASPRIKVFLDTLYSWEGRHAVLNAAVKNRITFTERARLKLIFLRLDQTGIHNLFRITFSKIEPDFIIAEIISANWKLKLPKHCWMHTKNAVQ